MTWTVSLFLCCVSTDNCERIVIGWAMHEFIFLCALDLGEEQLADRCLQPVLKRFPGSTRGQLLLGQWQEYKGVAGVSPT